VSLTVRAGFDPDRLKAHLEALLAAQGDDIFRLKGILAIAGDNRRHVLQAVHRILDLRPAGPWGAEPLQSRLVFIGRNLDRAALEAGLAACLK
jgi:G3E family GTPase